MVSRAAGRPRPSGGSRRFWSSICDYAWRAELELELLSGRSDVRRSAQKYQLKPAAINRHFKNHPIAAQAWPAAPFDLEPLEGLPGARAGLTPFPQLR